MDNKVFVFLFTLSLCFSAASVSAADFYAEVASGPIFVNTPSETATPIVLDLRLGLSRPKHQFELAIMSSINEDTVNQLTVETPLVASLLWHYIPEQESTLKVHTILGGSVVQVDADLPGLGASDEEYYGVSVGVGFEESFESIPQLKMSVDLINLYRGDELDIYTVTLGVHYDF